MNHGMSIKNGTLIVALPDKADIERVEVNGKTYTLPSRDCVDRQEAIEKMAGAIWLYPNELYPTLRHHQNAKDLAEYGLKDVPSAEPERIACVEVKLSKEEIQEAVDDAVKKMMAEMEEQEPRKKGKWIGKEQFANSPEFYSWQCSVCGCVLEDPTLDKPYPFCPNCGSYNGGEQE